jgi:hypothetical protein
MSFFIDADEIKSPRSTRKDTFDSLQVGMTNPSLKQQTDRIPSISFSDDGQRTIQSPSSIGQFHHSPEALPSANSAMRSNQTVDTSSSILKHNHTTQNILTVVPVIPIRSSPALRIWKQGLSIVCFLLIPNFDLIMYRIKSFVAN